MTGATLADRIRSFVAARCIVPAREKGLAEVTVRAGDVHREMGLSSQMPAVCGALAAKKFEAEYGILVVDRRGPAQGSNVFFVLQILDSPQQGPALPRVLPLEARYAPSTAPAKAQPQALRYTDQDLVLVACVAAKQAAPAPARELYISDWFRKARRHVESAGVRWSILSAQYGLVRPTEVLNPYERTLNTMSVSDRRAWAASVWSEIESQLSGTRRVVFFAGQRYREFLVERLGELGVQVDIPLEGLRIGEQLSWFSRDPAR
jgi:hypothetical protein